MSQHAQDGRAAAGDAGSLRPVEERLKQYGPFPTRRQRIVLFSTGSDYEDHGPALAPSSDTHFAQAFCTGAALRTGIRYLAHAPFTTDLVGDCARQFNPLYLPQTEYFERTAGYCVAALNTVEPRPEGVLILVPWHGQHIMAERIDEFAARLAVRKARLIPDIVVQAAFALTQDDYRDSPLAGLAREAVETRTFQHAGFLDYCVAEALGHLDRDELLRLRTEMEEDPDRTLRRHPAVPDLLGYIRYGGSEFDALRRVIREALGLKAEDPFPKVDAKWQNSCPIVGRAIVERTIQIAVQAILDFEAELFSDGRSSEG